MPVTMQVGRRGQLEIKLVVMPTVALYHSSATLLLIGSLSVVHAHEVDQAEEVKNTYRLKPRKKASNIIVLR